MTTKDLNAAIIAERTALLRLQRLLRAHGSPVSKLDAIEVAYTHWKQLAALIDAAGEREL